MKSIKKDFSNVLFLLKPIWQNGKFYMFMTLAVALLITPVFNVGNVIFIRVMMNSIGEGSAFSDIIVITAIFMSIMATASVISSISNVVGKIFREKINLKIRRDTYEKALAADYIYFDNPEFYDNYTWATDKYTNHVDQSMNLIKSFLTSFTMVTSMLAVIVSISPLVLLVAVGTTLGLVTTRVIANKVNLKRDKALLPLNRKLNYAQRVFYQREYAADLKNTHVSDHLFEMWDDKGAAKISVYKRFAFIETFLMSLTDIWTMLAMGAIILFVSYDVIVTGRIDSTGDVAALFTAIIMLISYLSRFSKLFTDANKLSIYTDKIKTYFEAESKIEVAVLTDSAGAITTPSLRATPPQEGNCHSQSFSVKLDNVSFAYPNSNFGLKNISISIAKGEKIAIVGENGAGKTTLAKLLLRLYDVDEGDILYNGNSIKTYDLRQLRGQIGVSFQNSNIYALNLADNLQVYSTTDEAALQDIATNVINKPDATIDAELTREFSNEGLMFSSGEAQRLGLGRLLTKDFGLLLLDEPSSTLDPISEYEVLKIISERAAQTTSIMVAHRLSTIRDVDCIYVMEAGRIIESGNHDTLIDKKGKYYEMFMKQSENYTK